MRACQHCGADLDALRKRSHARSRNALQTGRIGGSNNRPRAARNSRGPAPKEMLRCTATLPRRMTSSGLTTGWPGYVYAILAPELNRVKIGVAIRPRDRLRSLQCAAPTELVLHSSTHHKNPASVEAGVHRKLAHANVRGEWFDATDEQVVAWLAKHLRAAEREEQR